MEKKKFRWWTLFIPILLAVMVLAVVFWDGILIRVAPKAVLTSALTDVFSELELRFYDDPLLILVRSIDPNARYSADFEIRTSNDVLGTVGYDMIVQTDGAAHQLYAEGDITTSEKNLDLSLYMDADFMAVSSENLVQGNYYGITYDTFASDICSIPLLPFFLGDGLISQWNDSVQGIKEQMNRNYTLPEIPQFTAEDIQKALIGILALPCEIEHRSLFINDVYMECRALSYSAGGAQVNELLAGTHCADDAIITVTFYLYEESLVNICFDYRSEFSCAQCRLVLGENPAEETLEVQYAKDTDNWTITVDTTQQGEGQYSETWTFQGGEGRMLSISYDWIPSSGEMKLSVDDAQPIMLVLTETENGFQIETNDFADLLQIVTQDGSENGNKREISGIMTVSKGSAITSPAYKNLNQWSLNDFLMLLEGVGSIIGINIDL